MFCNICRFGTKDYLELDQHTIDSGENHRFRCPCCTRNALFYSLHHLREHIQSKHSTKIFHMAEEKANGGVNVYFCEFCGKKCKFLKEFIMHRAEHHQYHYKCPLCLEIYPHVASLFNHFHNSHALINNVDLYCKKCKVHFYSAQVFYNHQRSVHATTLDMNCLFCPETYKNPKIFNFHVHKHKKYNVGDTLWSETVPLVNGRPNADVHGMQCIICGHISRYLAGHMKSAHSDCKKCEKCQMLVPEKCLREHMSTMHKQQTLEQCLYCLAFLDASKMTLHKKKHLKRQTRKLPEKLWHRGEVRLKDATLSCSICKLPVPKKFVGSHNAVHQKEVDPEQCQTCYAFVQPQKMQMHLDKHTESNIRLKTRITRPDQEGVDIECNQCHLPVPQKRIQEHNKVHRQEQRQELKAKRTETKRREEEWRRNNKRRRSPSPVSRREMEFVEPDHVRYLDEPLAQDLYTDADIQSFQEQNSYSRHLDREEEPSYSPHIDEGRFSRKRHLDRDDSHFSRDKIAYSRPLNRDDLRSVRDQISYSPPPDRHDSRYVDEDVRSVRSQRPLDRDDISSRYTEEYVPTVRSQRPLERDDSHSRYTVISQRPLERDDSHSRYIDEDVRPLDRDDSRSQYIEEYVPIARSQRPLDRDDSHSRYFDEEVRPVRLQRPDRDHLRSRFIDEDVRPLSLDQERPRHLDRPAKLELVKCTECDAKFDTLELMVAHVKVMHFTQPQPPQMVARPNMGYGMGAGMVQYPQQRFMMMPNYAWNQQAYPGNAVGDGSQSQNNQQYQPTVEVKQETPDETVIKEEDLNPETFNEEELKPVDPNPESPSEEESKQVDPNPETLDKGEPKAEETIIQDLYTQLETVLAEVPLETSSQIETLCQDLSAELEQRIDETARHALKDSCQEATEQIENPVKEGPGSPDDTIQEEIKETAGEVEDTDQEASENLITKQLVIRLVRLPEEVEPPLEEEPEPATVSARRRRRPPPKYLKAEVQRLVNHLTHQQRPPTPAAQRHFFCEICCMTFNCFRRYWNHKTMQHAKHQFSCVNCPKQFKKTSALLHHTKFQHKNCPDAELEGGKALFYCEACGVGFRNIRSRQAHIESSHEGYLCCSVCNHACSSAEDLAFHTNEHKELKKTLFNCKVCHQEVYFLQVFLQHMRTHRKVVSPKSFTCKVCCGKVLGYIKFQEHMQEHLNASPKYPCSICSITYRSCGKLEQHLRFAHHQKAPAQKLSKQFKVCYWCGLSFHKNKMDEHMKKHASPKGERRVVECRVCLKGVVAWSYARHLAKHAVAARSLKKAEESLVEDASGELSGEAKAEEENGLSVDGSQRLADEVNKPEQELKEACGVKKEEEELSIDDKSAGADETKKSEDPKDEKTLGSTKAPEAKATASIKEKHDKTACSEPDVASKPSIKQEDERQKTSESIKTPKDSDTKTTASIKEESEKIKSSGSKASSKTSRQEDEKKTSGSSKTTEDSKAKSDSSTKENEEKKKTSIDSKAPKGPEAKSHAAARDKDEKKASTSIKTSEVSKAKSESSVKDIDKKKSPISKTAECRSQSSGKEDKKKLIDTKTSDPKSNASARDDKKKPSGSTQTPEPRSRSSSKERASRPSTSTKTPQSKKPTSTPTSSDKKSKLSKYKWKNPSVGDSRPKTPNKSGSPNKNPEKEVQFKKPAPKIKGKWDVGPKGAKVTPHKQARGPNTSFKKSGASRFSSAPAGKAPQVRPPAQAPQSKMSGPGQRPQTLSPGQGPQFPAPGPGQSQFPPPGAEQASQFPPHGQAPQFHAPAPGQSQFLPPGVDQAPQFGPPGQGPQFGPPGQASQFPPAPANMAPPQYGNGGPYNQMPGPPGVGPGPMGPGYMMPNQGYDMPMYPQNPEMQMYQQNPDMYNQSYGPMPDQFGYQQQNYYNPEMQYVDPNQYNYNQQWSSAPAQIVQKPVFFGSASGTTCKGCLKRFNTSKVLAVHEIFCVKLVDELAQLVTHVCPICMQQFTSLPTIKQHLFTSHSQIFKEFNLISGKDHQSASEIKQCKTCKQTFKSKEDLAAHEMTHEFLASIKSDLEKVDVNKTLLGKTEKPNRVSRFTVVAPKPTHSAPNPPKPTNASSKPPKPKNPSPKPSTSKGESSTVVRRLQESLKKTQELEKAQQEEQKKLLDEMRSGSFKAKLEQQKKMLKINLLYYQKQKLEQEKKTKALEMMKAEEELKRIQRDLLLSQKGEKVKDLETIDLTEKADRKKNRGRSREKERERSRENERRKVESPPRRKVEPTHKPVRTLNLKPGQEMGAYQCKKCATLFTNYRDYITHMELHEEEDDMEENYLTQLQAKKPEVDNRYDNRQKKSETATRAPEESRVRPEESRSRRRSPEESRSRRRSPEQPRSSRWSPEQSKSSRRSPDESRSRRRSPERRSRDDSRSTTRRSPDGDSRSRRRSPEDSRLRRRRSRSDERPSRQPDSRPFVFEPPSKPLQQQLAFEPPKFPALAKPLVNPFMIQASTSGAPSGPVPIAPPKPFVATYMHLQKKVEFTPSVVRVRCQVCLQEFPSQVYLDYHSCPGPF